MVQKEKEVWGIYVCTLIKMWQQIPFPTSISALLAEIQKILIF